MPNRPPTAGFTFNPLEVPPGDNYTTEFVFTATASDPDGDPLTYQWQFTGGNPNTATGQVAASSRAWAITGSPSWYPMAREGK
ncbi:MAG: hypothetical protein IIB11_06100 [Chloroflexi bacterium]|nr:hypothetical protein [Chloroflexota bacterium]